MISIKKPVRNLRGLLEDHNDLLAGSDLLFRGVYKQITQQIYWPYYGLANQITDELKEVIDE